MDKRILRFISECERAGAEIVQSAGEKLRIKPMRSNIDWNAVQNALNEIESIHDWPKKVIQAQHLRQVH